MMWDIELGSGGAVACYAISQKRNPFCHGTFFDIDPAAKGRSLAAPMRVTLLGRDGNELAGPLIQGRVISDQRQHPGADTQAASHRRRMRQPPRLFYRRAAARQGLLRKPETEKNQAQPP